MIPNEHKSANTGERQLVVVLVDDNDMDNEYHQIVLRRFNPELPVVVHFSGQSFLDFLRTAQRDARYCVFLDINMPRMSGFDVLNALRKEDFDHDGMAVFLLTSSASPEDRSRAAASGQVTGFLTKPLTASMLAEALRTD